MIFRQKKRKKKEKLIENFNAIFFLVDFVPQSQHPSHIIPNYMCNPERKMSSQTLNVIPNLLRDLIIVPQNRSFQASLSGHPPRRHFIPPAVDCFAGPPIAPTRKSFTRVENTKKNCVKHQN